MTRRPSTCRTPSAPRVRWSGAPRCRSGRSPGRSALGLHLTDVVVHGWNLARATGRSIDVPADVAEQALRVLPRGDAAHPAGPGSVRAVHTGRARRGRAHPTGGAVGPHALIGRWDMSG